MMKRLSMLALVVLMVSALVPAVASADADPGQMMITGVIDGPLSGGVPKAVEVTALTEIPDLTMFGLGSANNGGGTDGEEFTFPAGSAGAGDVFYIASEDVGFTSYFGFAPDHTSGAMSINGDDAIELFLDGSVVDVFGDIDTDGTGEPWEYQDGWAYRIAPGTAPDGTFDIEQWCFSGPNALDGDTSNDTSADPFPPSAEDCEDTEPPGPAEVFIHDVQGAGSSTPLAGERVIVEGIVVGDYETFDHLAGFFVQEEDADADADPTTSEGIFVFNHAGDDVSVGDLVRVEGTAEERFGNTQLTDFVEIEVLSSGNPLPTPGPVSMPLTSYGDWEAVEGMRATVADSLVVSEYFNFDRFGDTVLAFPMPGEDRLHQPTAVHDPYSAEAEARADWNAANQITIDDGLPDQNPDTVVHPILRDDVTLDNYFRGGDTVTGVTGPVFYSFGQYRILPDGFTAYTPNLRPGVPDVGGRLTAVSFNALNYFLTLDGSGPVCGPDLDQFCRGADFGAEFDRQRAKTLQAMIAMDADLFGIQEVENTAGVYPLADLVAGLNDHFGPDTYTYVDAGLPGPDVIKVGIIYRRTALTQIGETAVLDTDEFLDPLGVGIPLNRAAVAASFLEKGTGEKFSVVVNHLKSKGSGCGSGDDDVWAGSCNATRAASAQVLADWLETNPTDSKDTDWLILGDLNSYDREEPIDVLRAAGYVDLVGHYGGEFAYSYLFSAQLGYLDYAMANESLADQVTGTAVWHSNADEADLFDYDLSFKSDTQDTLFDPTNPYRSSDHDPVIVGLALDQKPGKGNKSENK